ncbi:hypothetical protein D9M72_634510 [compost metagenome]
MRAEQAGQCQCSRGLCAVDECETFLRSQNDGLETCLIEGSRRWKAFALIEGFAFADHGRCHMSERCEIARSANRTLGRDHRDHAFFEHGFDEGYEFKPHA